MRKMKKINGYLVVRFNDREKREYEGTGLGSYGVIDAEQYTGILDIDRSVMEYDDADTLEMAMEQARELESELDIVEPETKITVIIEGETGAVRRTWSLSACSASRRPSWKINSSADRTWTSPRLPQPMSSTATPGPWRIWA